MAHLASSEPTTLFIFIRKQRPIACAMPAYLVATTPWRWMDWGSSPLVGVTLTEAFKEGLETRRKR